MGRYAVLLFGVLVLTLLAGGLTEATLAVGQRADVVNDVLLRPLTGRPAATPSPTATPSVVVSPSTTASATPVATATPAAAVSGPTATTNSFVHLRAGKSTATDILVDLNGGTVVQLLSDSDAQWQEVSYNGTVGYIFKSYLAY